MNLSAVRPGRRTGLALLMLSVALVACEGDERPFVEAVEVRDLDLASIAIVPPDGGGLDADGEPLAFSVGIDERVDLDVRALTRSGGDAELDVADRDWSVDDSAVLSVDSDGRVTGRSDGIAFVGLTIGGLEAEPFRVEVNGAPLVAIDRIDGPASPEPCLAAEYVAIGTFASGSPRALTDVLWSLPTGTDARLPPPDDDLTAGRTELVVTQSGAGPVTLLATSAGVEGRRTLQVAGSLEGLAFAPAGPPLAIGATRDLTATASYVRAGVPADEPLSGTLEWRVLSGSDVVSVDNEGEERGRVTGLSAGSATIEAACGDDVTATTVISVSAASGSDADDELSFEQGRSVSLAINATRQLRVSTGDDYDEDDDVTDDVIFTSDNPAVVEVVANGASAGLLTARTAGDTNVSARLDGTSVSIAVTVR